MKLKQCEIGKVVHNKSELSGNRVGHIVGFTYNVHPKHTGSMTSEELIERTIPLVRFPDGDEYGVHPVNLELL